MRIDPDDSRRQAADRRLRVRRRLTGAQRVDVKRNAEQAVMTALVSLGRGDGSRDRLRVPVIEALRQQQLLGGRPDFVQGHDDGIAHQPARFEKRWFFMRSVFRRRNHFLTKGHSLSLSGWNSLAAGIVSSTL